MSGRASGLLSLSDEVLLAFKIRKVLYLSGAAYPSCPRKKAIK